MTRTAIELQLEGVLALENPAADIDGVGIVGGLASLACPPDIAQSGRQCCPPAHLRARSATSLNCAGF